MLIEIENTSSPGASFTNNTNEVLLITYEWICEHNGITIPFRDFRNRLQSEKGINDNNNRNIYPLLKNGGLVKYEKGADLLVDSFFTNRGRAYIRALETIKDINESDYSKEQKTQSIKRMELILNEIIFGALREIVSQQSINYVSPFQDMIRFILQFDRINKVEYAYLLFVKQRLGIDDALSSMKETINDYRHGNIEIEVSVNVRNDLDLREKTKRNNRKEGLSYLTSFGYFTSLLQQSGLVYKDDKYYVIAKNKRDFLEQLGG